MGPKWISLRWKEPYPPFGRVESYKIEYNKQRSGTRTIQIGSKSSPCDLWDNMICVTLESLEKNITYEIKVQAFNSNIGGQITAQSTRTVEKAPTAPLNLTVISAVENKTTMYWQHPDKTNGKLNKFKFRVTAVETWLLQSQGLNFNWEYNIMRETRNYTYTVRCQQGRVELGHGQTCFKLDQPNSGGFSKFPTFLVWVTSIESAPPTGSKDLRVV
ncbi:unnamed protein product, partial [Timema podura]|nr:unnamed protein product [Timema podura]